MGVSLCSFRLLTGPSTRTAVACRVPLKLLSNQQAISHPLGIHIVLFSAWFCLLCYISLFIIRHLHGPRHVFNADIIQYSSRILTCSLLPKELRLKIIAVLQPREGRDKDWMHSETAGKCIVGIVTHSGWLYFYKFMLNNSFHWTEITYFWGVVIYGWCIYLGLLIYVSMCTHMKTTKGH